MQNNTANSRLFRAVQPIMVVCMLFFVANLYAQDTLQRQLLDEVSVDATSVPSAITSSSPTQVIGIERLQRQGISQLSDAVRQMAGISLKDYGGVGGLKTVSARGLGSQFSGLIIDGVAVNDCQNGQIDMGRYLLGNTAFVSHANGQPSELLQTARAYAIGSVVQMSSKVPEFALLRRTHIRLGVDGGSFGYCSPHLLWEQRVGRRAVLSLWSSYLTSDGDYPFTLRYGPSPTDSTSQEWRSNSQVKMATIDANLFVPFGKHDMLRAKAHYVKSYHALPGPVTFYNHIKSSEHSEEELLFVQSQYRHIWSPRWSLLLTGKAQMSADTYEDTSARTATGEIYNLYRQREGYLSAAVKWVPLEGLSLSLATDGVANSLKSNLAQNQKVHRYSSLTALALAYRRGRWESNGNLLATVIEEHASTAGGSSYQRLSPYFGLTYRIAKGLRVRYFFKESYRMPSMNEMYYFVMSRSLKPERAMQHNVGMAYATGSYEGREFYLSATADAYRNRVTDKLVAVPTNNMFLWSMMNLGTVDIGGVDATVSAVWCEAPDSNGVRWSLTAGYSFQHAVDHTDRQQKTFGHQIPYTPRHSGNMSLTCEMHWVDISYTLLMVGRRYCLQQNVAENLVPGYADHSLSLSKRVDLPWGVLTLRLHVLNLLNVQYEVVKSYPMMGRNWRVSAVWDF